MSAQRIEVGIDWLACSYPADAAQDAALWAETMIFAEDLSKRGETVREGSLLGYRGVYAGKLFVGQRDDGMFIRASGPLAMEAFERLYVYGLHVSRLDLQVTVWFTPSEENTGIRAERLASLYNERLPLARQRKLTTYETNQGGYTLYIGSRTSDHYCRLYNKFAESKEELYRGAWRFEVELHNASATKCCEALIDHEGAIKAPILATVREYYKERGVELPWAYSAEAPLSFAVDRAMTDDETSIRWLTNQVRPTVARLIKKGYTTDVLEALDLAHLFYIAVQDHKEEAP